MKKEQITDLFDKFEAASVELNNIECWSARILSELFGYADWRNFLNVIEKAKTACDNSGEQAENHFVDITKMVKIGSRNYREVENKTIARYGFYLNSTNCQTLGSLD